MTVDDIAVPLTRRGYTYRLLCYFAALGPDIVATHDDLTDLLYRGREDGGPEWRHQHGVLIANRIRPRLRPGWRIDNLHSIGYTLRQGAP